MAPPASRKLAPAEEQPASVASGPGASPAGASEPLATQIRAAIAAHGGWIDFEDYMARALYTPGLGYYSRGSRQFGALPSSGSDFITAPELSPLFARALARQIAQALSASDSTEVWEFGAGSGALAAGLLQALGEQVSRYTIVDLSGSLRAQQQRTVQARVPSHAHKLHFAEHWPVPITGVVVGNELLDAMPVALLTFDGHQWLERGVTVDAQGALAWADRPTALRPPLNAEHFPPGSVTELPRQASAWVSSLAGSLQRGAAFLIDYGFPEHEYYHPQRSGGTLMCHRSHQADANPLEAPGDKDITSHVDFTAIALAGQDAGLTVLGYTSQARFLLNCGLAEDLQFASDAGDVRTLGNAQKLITEHEMGELFKVIGFSTTDAEGEPLFDALGFQAGDRSHTL
jgi:SAM-dependent MidA family methyltransferase